MDDILSALSRICEFTLLVTLCRGVAWRHCAPLCAVRAVQIPLCILNGLADHSGWIYYYSYYLCDLGPIIPEMALAWYLDRLNSKRSDTLCSLLMLHVGLKMIHYAPVDLLWYVGKDGIYYACRLVDIAMDLYTAFYLYYGDAATPQGELYARSDPSEA